MRITRFISALMILIAVGCTNTPEPTLPLPTLALLPSPTVTATSSITPTPTSSVTPTFTPPFTFTPSNTPTDTPPPSVTTTFTFTPSLTYSLTPLPTNTRTPSPTPTFTPTDTFTPSLTPSETRRPTLTPSPTRTRTPLPTLTPLPTNTNTPTPPPTATPTYPGPTIYSFGTTTQSVLPNSPVTFAFSSQADGARLELLGVNSVPIQTFPVLPTGTYAVIVPDTLGRLLTYRFVAVRGGAEVARTLQITITCPVNWFFGDQYAPPNASCPTAAGAIGDGRFQPFERGVMLFVNANGLNRIYGLQDEGARYIAYANGWDGSTINSSAPPSGRFIPAQMFNWVYYSTLAPIGSWNGAIGWGTTDINADPRTIQWEGAPGGSGAFYIDAPGGAVYRFSGGDSGVWTRLR
ncbi:MAG: hypothetical protein L6Q98_05140 [Anaerolineae bacterium]|nr:hypothetical protein [Anaerolineae bacterium]